MKFDWRKIARIAAAVSAPLIPSAVAIEVAVEGIVDASKGSEKARAVTEVAIGALEAEGELRGRQYATPRVKDAIRAVNDANIALLNALAEAHAMGRVDTPPEGRGTDVEKAEG